MEVVWRFCIKCLKFASNTMSPEKKKLKMIKWWKDKMTQMTRYNIMFHILILSFILTVNGLCTLNDDSMLYNETLFLGTHNSAINLGPHTPFRLLDYLFLWRWRRCLLPETTIQYVVNDTTTTTQQLTFILAPAFNDAVIPRLSAIHIADVFTILVHHSS